MTVLERPTPSTYKSRGFAGEHRGDDWGFLLANPGETQKILASAAGEVIEVYSGNLYNGGWGRRIRIRHAGGAITAYNHMRPGGVHVHVGQQVSAGQHIGDMGESGAARGRHLHHELYINGARVNPEPYYSQHLPGTAPGAVASVGNGQVLVLDTPWYWYNSAEDAQAQRNVRGGQYTGEPMMRGRYAVLPGSGNGAVQVRANDGSTPWLHSDARALIQGSAPLPTPAPVQALRPHVRITEPWFVYGSEHDAYHAQNKRGTVGANAPGEGYLLTDYGNNGKPVQIEAPGQSGVRNAGRYWIGSRHTAAPVVFL